MQTVFIWVFFIGVGCLPFYVIALLVVLAVWLLLLSLRSGLWCDCERCQISAGCILHVIRSFQAKIAKNAKKDHITWRPWPLRTSTFGIMRCDNFWPNFQETTKNPEGFKKLSEFGNSSLEGYKSSKTLVSLCFGAIREGRMIPWPISADFLNPRLSGLLSFSVQTFGSKVQKVFTLGGRCQLPKIASDSGRPMRATKARKATSKGDPLYRKRSSTFLDSVCALSPPQAISRGWLF